MPTNTRARIVGWRRDRLVAPISSKHLGRGGEAGLMGPGVDGGDDEVAGKKERARQHEEREEERGRITTTLIRTSPSPSQSNYEADHL